MATTTETTTQLNRVFLNSGNADVITGVTYNNTLEVTSGQPVVGVPSPSQRSSTSWEIDLVCGRHGSSTIAKDFKAASGGSDQNLMGLEVAAGSTHPDDLNFFYGIEVLFAGETSPVTVYLGQGHITLTFQNNWWIGSPALSNQGGAGGLASLLLPSGRQVSVQQGDDDQTFLFAITS